MESFTYLCYIFSAGSLLSLPHTACSKRVFDPMKGSRISPPTNKISTITGWNKNKNKKYTGLNLLKVTTQNSGIYLLSHILTLMAIYSNHRWLFYMKNQYILPTYNCAWNNLSMSQSNLICSLKVQQVQKQQYYHSQWKYVETEHSHFLCVSLLSNSLQRNLISHIVHVVNNSNFNLLCTSV